MKAIPTTNPKYSILVDDEDYDRVKLYNWCIHGAARGYNITRRIDSTQRPHIKLSNYIMRNNNVIYDHIDRNFLNNQKENLRICTATQNAQNKTKLYSDLINYSSKYKGVAWYSRGKKWMVRIRANHENYFIGYFKDELEAAHAYDKAALKYHGEFACLNFPPTY